MERVCKNCTHFNPDTSICNFKNLIKLEDDWCCGFFAKEKEKEMTVFDIKDQLSLFTDYELNNILDMTRQEIARRDKERREELKRNFFKAWKALTDDGGNIFLSGELREPLYIEDVEIE